MKPIVESNFDVIDYDDKTAKAPPDHFGYRAVHYDCRLRADHADVGDDLRSIVFEIQVRTIGQDAWAAVEHHLQYKGQYSIPDELKADINALVGLFHVADKTFQNVYDKARQADLAAVDIVSPIVAELSGGGELEASVDVGLDLSTLKALLRGMYSARSESQGSAYSNFVEDLAVVGIRGVRQLRDLLVNGEASALDSESTVPPGDEDESATKFADVGFAREAVFAAHPVFRRQVEAQIEELERKAEEVHRNYIEGAE
jgi:putative GTP pyrophosphokinase